MPPEWEKHEKTIIEWPVKTSMVWPENYQEVCNGYAEVANAISDFEKVTMIVNDNEYEYARNLCKEAVEVIVIPHNDAWFRDNGPTFVYDKEKVLYGVNWQFNAWGEKYVPFDLDNQVAPKLLSKEGIPCIDNPIILEGGSIHVDGEGTLLSTEECLLNPNRNPHLSKSEIEDQLRKQLNVNRFIWLKKGLFGDETDGHVDNIACFGKPGLILIQTCDNPEDPNFDITQENLEIIRQATDHTGKPFNVVEIPQPPIRYYNEQRLTLSYLNFYFVNEGIILPVFGEDASETDEQAKSILQELYPERKIVCVDGMALIKEGGNVHCITQQMPKIF